jgi:hypothetical protein
MLIRDKHTDPQHWYESSGTGIFLFNTLLTWKAFPRPLSSRSSVRQFPPPEHAAKHVTFCSIRGTVLLSTPAPPPLEIYTDPDLDRQALNADLDPDTP